MTVSEETDRKGGRFEDSGRATSNPSFSVKKTDRESGLFFFGEREEPERRVRRGEKHRSAAGGGRSEVLL